MDLFPLKSKEKPLQLTKKGKKPLRFLLNVGKDYLTHIQENTAAYSSRGALHNLFHRLLVNNIAVGEWIQGRRYYSLRFADPDVFLLLHHYFDPPLVWRGTVSWLLTRHAPHVSTTMVKRYSKAFIEHFQEVRLVGEVSVTSFFSACSPVVGDQVPVCKPSKIQALRRELYFMQLLLFASLMYVHLRYIKKKEGQLEAEELTLDEGARWKNEVTSFGENLKGEEDYRQLLTNSDMQSNIRDLEEKTHIRRVKKMTLPSLTRLEEELVATCEEYHETLSSALSFLLNLVDQI